MTTQLTAYEFLDFHRRMPFVDEGEQPWQYRGWLRLMVQQIHMGHPAVPDRWGYLFECISTKRLPQAPIPQLEMLDNARPEGVKLIERAVSQISSAGHSSWSAFELFVSWLSFGLDTKGSTAPSFSDKLNEALYRSVDLEPWFLGPYDYLGAYAAETLGGGPNAFFPTPMSIVNLICRMTFADTGARDTRLMTVSDPAVGTGRFLLGASNYSLMLSGQDIDPLMVAICMINGMLYAPWLCFPPKIEGKQLPPRKQIVLPKKMPPRKTGI